MLLAFIVYCAGMATIGFLPVRGGSKSIPNKNRKLLFGKPLLYWNLIALQDCPLIDQIILATDSQDLIETAKSFGFDKLNCYARSAESATDSAPTEMVLLEYLKSTTTSPSDELILVQATSPFTTSADLTNAIELYRKEAYDSLLSCVRTKHFLWDNDGKSVNYNFENRPRRQDFTGNLQENGALYISTVGHIIRSGNRISGNIGIYEMEAYTALELDEPHDWIIAEKLMEKYRDEK